MPLRNSRLRSGLSSTFSLLLCLAGACCALGAGSAALWAQSAGSGNGSKAKPSLVREQQQPLLMDHDPVEAPEEAATGEATPAKPESSKGTALVRTRNGTYTLERNVDEVVLSATVFDKKHHLVTSLSRTDFKVYEDGVPQSITSFQHSDIPIALGLLVDNSGSMRPKRQAVNRSTLDLVRASNPQDESFVVNFSDEAYIDQDFTSSITKLRDGLSHIDSKGGTALYDAVVASADYMAKNARRSKQVLLIVTDGEDNASSMTLEQTVRRVQQLQGPVIYCIGLLFDSDSGSRATNRAKRVLQLLADDTGGLAFFPKNLGQVDQVAQEVAQDIRQQYTIGYRSTKPASEGGFRTIRVDAEAKGLGKLTVRTRAGYYPDGEGGVAASAPGGARSGGSSAN